MLDDIENGGNAPRRDVKSIERATQTWFKYMKN